jgi:hypothetical protein
MVIVLATAFKIRGFKPCRGQWIFKGDNNPSHDFFGREVKLWAPRRKILQHVEVPCEVFLAYLRHFLNN